MLELLRQHPQYGDHFAPKLEAVPADARDRYLFMLAAPWPDDVRRNKQYHHGSWHYVNLPYSPGGQAVRPTPTQNILGGLPQPECPQPGRAAGVVATPLTHTERSNKKTPRIPGCRRLPEGRKCKREGSTRTPHDTSPKQLSAFAHAAFASSSG